MLHPFPDADDEPAVLGAVRDPARLAAVRDSGLLDAPPDAALDRLARLASTLLATPLATVTLIDGDRQYYAACVGLPEPVATVRETPLDLSFCRLTVVAREPLAIPDTRVDERTRRMRSVTEFGVHAYAGVPLFFREQAVGTLCVMDQAPRAWTAHELAVLDDLAASVTTEMELRAAARESARQSTALREVSRELAAAGEELRASNAELAAARDAAERDRRRLATVLDALPAGVLIAEAPHGRIVYGNRQVEAILRHPLRRTPSALEYGEWVGYHRDGRRVEAGEWPLARALAGAVVEGDEYLYEKGDHTRGWIRIAGAPVRDADGAVTGSVVALFDIDQEKRAESAHRRLADAALAITRTTTLGDALREATEHARRIVGAHDAVATVTPAAGPPIRVHSASDAPGPTAGAHGRLAAPLVGSDGGSIGLLELTDRCEGAFTTSDEAILVQLAQMVSAAVEKAQADAAVLANAERTRRLLDVSAALTQAVTPEQVAAVVATAVMRAVGADAASLSVVTPGGTEAEILSAAGYGEARVEPWRRFSLDLPVPVAHVVRTGESLWLGSSADIAADYPALDVLREMPHVCSTAVVALTAEGRTIGALVLGFAETQAFGPDDRAVLTAVAHQCAQALERARLYDAERRARAAAEGARRRAEEANRAKFDFLATMSHELRTPLNAIGGYVELLELELRGPITEDQRRDLARVKRAQTHLLGLINDVLNFAKLDAGRVRYQIADTVLADAVASVEAMIAPQLRAKGLAYTAAACDPAVIARADADKLRQILLNLLSNAMKFTESGGQIAVSCDVEGERALLRVADSGTGIPEDKVATIFDPFVQVDRGLSRPSEGIGLGLAISRDLARGMGGDLTAESAMGQGSVFTLTLPRG